MGEAWPGRPHAGPDPGCRHEGPGRARGGAPGEYRAKAFLFDSYARGDATAESDVYIMVIEPAPAQGLTETGKIRESLYKHLGCGKNINVTLADEATFEEWKGADGTAHHAVATEGVRLF